MTDTSAHLRRLTRTSGLVALFGVALFATVGIVQLRIGQAPPNPSLGAPVGAGARASAPDKPIAIWGAEVTDPAAVACEWLTPERISATLTQADDHVVVVDPALGPVTLVGTINAPSAREFTCSGGGITSFASSHERIGPEPNAVGIGFLVGAGIAGLWALLMLRVSRSRQTAPRF